MSYDLVAIPTNEPKLATTLPQPRKPEWFVSTEEVWMFGRSLLKGGMFDALPNARLYSNERAREAANNLLDYFEKPWHWSREHAWWMANDRTDDPDKWELGRDAEWEVSPV